MGGAERNARKRRQAQLAAQPTAGTSEGKAAKKGTKVVASVAAAAVLGLAVTLGIVFTGSSDQAIPVASQDSDIAEVRDGVTVVRGDDGAETTIDIYVDFLCPACEAFEESFGEQIVEYIEAGQLQVRTHPVPMLVDQSEPAGYSLDAANASLCAADEGQFTTYHDSLFAAQPEGDDVYDTGDLVTLGRDIGITGDAFASCVTEGDYDEELTAQFDNTRADESLHQDLGDGPQFSTPTVVHEGSIVPIGDDADWLAELVEHSDDNA